MNKKFKKKKDISAKNTPHPHITTPPTAIDYVVGDSQMTSSSHWNHTIIPEKPISQVTADKIGCNIALIHEDNSCEVHSLWKVCKRNYVERQEWKEKRERGREKEGK